MTDSAKAKFQLNLKEKQRNPWELWRTDAIHVYQWLGKVPQMVRISRFLKGFYLEVSVKGKSAIVRLFVEPLRLSQQDKPNNHVGF